MYNINKIQITQIRQTSCTQYWTKNEVKEKKQHAFIFNWGSYISKRKLRSDLPFARSENNNAESLPVCIIIIPSLTLCRTLLNLRRSLTDVCSVWQIFLHDLSTKKNLIFVKEISIERDRIFLCQCPAPRTLQ